MTMIYRRAALLAGFAALTGCAKIDPPPPEPQPPAQITATSDATYMRPVGAPIEHVVPEPAPNGPFDDWRLHTAPRGGRTASGATADGDRVAALENRVSRLEEEVGHLTAQNRHAVRSVETAPAVAPEIGAAAPAPASVQPEALTAAATAAPVPLAAPVKSAPAPKAVGSARTAAGKVGGLRIGEHPGLTRIVLDCGEKHPFHVDLDNDEHILTVQVAGAAWSAGRGEHAVPHSPLVTSWQAAPDGRGGTRFVVQLRHGAKLSADHFLPDAAPGAARLVIDLKPQ